ncbi:MAG: hypothetical protein ACYS0C_09010 [Planctomycetota bacterium]|jgi:hypothetical protein
MNGSKLNKRKSLFMACVPLLLLAGCAKTQQFEVVEQICLPDMSKPEAMQIAEDVLSKMQFTIDKADTESGFIRTNPLPGAQFFEFWRSDNVGAYNFTYANLHSIRRIVELDISKRDGQLCIDCNVNTQRLSLPDRQVTSSARVYEMFSQSSSLKQKLKLNPDQKKGMAWADSGKDTRLETEILKRIEKRTGARAP